MSKDEFNVLLTVLGIIICLGQPGLVPAQEGTGYGPYGLYIEETIIDGKLYREQEIKRLKEKHKSYIEMIKNNPNNPIPLFYLGSLYMALNKPQEAIHAFNDSLKLNPKNPETHFSLGKAYDKVRDGNNAIKHIETAQQIFKDDFDLFGQTRTKPILKALKKQYFKIPKNSPN